MTDNPDALEKCADATSMEDMGSGLLDIERLKVLITGLQSHFSKAEKPAAEKVWRQNKVTGVLAVLNLVMIKP